MERKKNAEHNSPSLKRKKYMGDTATSTREPYNRYKYNINSMER